MIIFLTQRAQRAQRFYPHSYSRLRWSGRKLRYNKSAQRVLSTPSPTPYFRTDDEKKASHYHHNANERFGFNLFLLAIISSFDKK